MTSSRSKAKGDLKRYQGELSRTRRWFRTSDGVTLRTRLIGPADTELLIDFFRRLSPESRRRRFHSDVEHLSEEVIEDIAIGLTHVDNSTGGGAVVALERSGKEEQIVCVARLMRPAGEPANPLAEAAIVVRDDYQGRGVGTEMLRRLVLLAKQMHIQTMLAVIEADNTPAVRLFRQLGLPTETDTSHGVTEMRIEMPR